LVVLRQLLVLLQPLHLLVQLEQALPCPRN
jgi:hypothetical protein